MELDDYDECKDLALYTFNRQYAIGMTPDRNYATSGKGESSAFKNTKLEMIAKAAADTKRQQKVCFIILYYE